MNELRTNNRNKIVSFTASLLMVSALTLAGCSSSKSSSSLPQYNTEPPAAHQITSPAPGVVGFVWEEPMVDVIDVPPGLDPEGIYYRPAHQSIVEIRQGRWKYHQAK